MESLIEDIKNGVNYAFSDTESLIIISLIFLMVSFVNRHHLLKYTIFSLSNVLMIIPVGYGSLISYYTINGLDKHPHIRKIKIIIKEGIKKSLILGFYSLFLVFMINHFEIFLTVKQFFLAFIFLLLFCLIYLILIGGLLNRYLNKGNFFKAFHIVEIVKLLKSFDLNLFIRLLISIIIAQLALALCLVRLNKPFDIIDVFFVILSFLLHPVIFVTTKRLIGIQTKRLVQNH